MYTLVATSNYTACEATLTRNTGWKTLHHSRVPCASLLSLNYTILVTVPHSLLVSVIETSR